VTSADDHRAPGGTAGARGTTGSEQEAHKKGSAVAAETEIWADVSGLSPEATPSALAHVRNSAAATLVARADQLAEWQPLERVKVACIVAPPGGAELDGHSVDTVVAASPEMLDMARSLAGARQVGVRCEITDHASMDAAAQLCGSTDVLIASFADETNIPLELLLAKAQSTHTRVLKELRGSAEAAVVAGVLETGPHGLLVRGEHLADLGRVADALQAHAEDRRELVPLEVVRAEPVGMGYRGCVDTASLFDPDEGMIVGSTSEGGVLVCAEVHHLPYMKLRPFRVNAGAVHSYVFGPQTTAYITDLAAGERIHAVAADGRFREVLVGRVKVELRPLRLVAARHAGVTVNVLLQDDWHVRVMSAEHRPLNLTEVQAGTELLGYVCPPGRHVGIKVAEKISEF
jgi:3-amino-4-hydroxybenzoic acid synthase